MTSRTEDNRHTGTRRERDQGVTRRTSVHRVSRMLVSRTYPRSTSVNPEDVTVGLGAYEGWCHPDPTYPSFVETTGGGGSFVRERDRSFTVVERLATRGMVSGPQLPSQVTLVTYVSPDPFRIGLHSLTLQSDYKMVGRTLSLHVSLLCPPSPWRSLVVLGVVTRIDDSRSDVSVYGSVRLSQRVPRVLDRTRCGLELVPTLVQPFVG